MTAVEIVGSGKDEGIKFTLFIRHIMYYRGDDKGVTIYLVNGASLNVDVSYDKFKQAIEEEVR